MARRHVGFGLCGLFVVFLAVLIFVPKQISGFNDISIVAIPESTPPVTASPQAKPKPQKQKRTKQSRF